MRSAYLVLPLALLLEGCPATRRLPVAPDAAVPAGDAALLVEQHEYGGPNLQVKAVDGRRVPPDSFWTLMKSHWEVELAPGPHTIEVSYFDGESHSTQNALLQFTAEADGHYEVRGARIKHGFWSEVGKSLWPLVNTSWVAWVVDTRTEAVVAGIAPEQGPFRAEVPADARALPAARELPNVVLPTVPPAQRRP